MMRRHLFWSAILGPPVAFLGGIAASIVHGLFVVHDDRFKLRLGWFDWLTVAMLAVFLIYVIGILPSIAAGVANGQLSNRISDLWVRRLLALFIGAALGLATLLVLRRPMFWELGEALIWMSAGAVGSLIPAMLASRRT